MKKSLRILFNIIGFILIFVGGLLSVLTIKSTIAMILTYTAGVLIGLSAYEEFMKIFKK